MSLPRQISLPRGFTLIELLTSVAIASIIMLLLLGLMDQSSSTYRTSQSAVNTLSESRAFFAFFEEDLSSRLPSTALMSEQSGTSDKIAFIRAQSHDEQISPTEGDLQTSLYYVAFTNDQAGTVSPKLFRRTINAKDTQTLIESSSTPAIPIGQPAQDEPIVYNVVSFKATPKQYSAAGKPETWTPTSTSPPALVELTLEITDDFAAARFKSESSWSQLRDPANKKARESVRSFTRTFILPQ